MTSSPDIDMGRWINRQTLWVWGLVLLAWVLMTIPVLTGHPHLFHHLMHGMVSLQDVWPRASSIAVMTMPDSIIEMSMTGGGHISSMNHDHGAMDSMQQVSTLTQLGLFVVTWLVMTVAMMLPTIIPAINQYVAAGQNSLNRQATALCFMLAYMTVWTSFGVFTFGLNQALHWSTITMSWFHQHEWVGLGVILLVAGGFQFTTLKTRCTKQCHTSLMALPHPDGVGMAQAWSGGFRHGLLCLGCCWSLMLVMAIAGLCSLSIMLALTGAMVLEKNFKQGQKLGPVAGVGLMSWGTLLLLNHL